MSVIKEEVLQRQETAESASITDSGLQGGTDTRRSRKKLSEASFTSILNYPFSLMFQDKYCKGQNVLVDYLLW